MKKSDRVTRKIPQPTEKGWFDSNGKYWSLKDFATEDDYNNFFEEQGTLLEVQNPGNPSRCLWQVLWVDSGEEWVPEISLTVIAD